MTRTTRTRLNPLILTALLGCQLSIADDYLDARERLVAAYQAEDYALMVQAATEALAARPSYPNAIYNRAMAQMLAGNTDGALASVMSLASKQVDFGVESNAVFDGLKDAPGFERYLAAMEATRESVGTPEIAFELSDGHFVPEGIAVDGDTLYLGSIRNGDILRVDPDGTRSLLSKGDAGSVYGMRLVGSELWFTAAATPQYRGPATVSGTGLFALDVDDSSFDTRAALPAKDGPQILGDLLVEEDVIYASDQMDGRVYRYDRDARTFEVLLDKGTLKSPQGMARDREGRSLYVADYVGGLYRLSTDDGSAKRIAGPDEFSLYGIDGLYRHGNWLIAIQNGIRPHRVVALELAETGDRIRSGRILAMNHDAFDEPNLGTIANDRFYFIANSHWNRFDADNELPDELSGPVILSVPLPE